MKYRVIIPTAGLGTRLKGLSKNLNKALISIAHRPAISYIIEKFPVNVEFVIPLGYQANSVRNFLGLAYPERKFIFVEIDKFEGDGSGLGYTLLQCKDHLQLPFIFVSNDTLVLEEIRVPEFNWMGYAHTDDNSQYRSIRLENRRVSEICAKGADGDVRAYIGLAGIFDFKEFWSSMESGINEGSIEIGESFGLRSLIERGIDGFQYTWFDTGNLSALQKTREYYKGKEEANILEKEGEAIWFVEDKVVKFSIDSSFIKNRVKRASEMQGFVPEIINSTENMYLYRKVKGEVLSANPTIANFKYFLNWINTFWKKIELSKENSQNFRNICMEFYRTKTYQRVKQYFTTFEQIDAEEIINGNKIYKVFNMLEKVNWEELSNGIPVRFHGDLHFENILINDVGKAPFTLLDWRQDFGGIIDYGDIYYDFAKLNHGLIISHGLIDQNLFNVKRRVNVIQYDFLRKQTLVECEYYFKEWIETNGYDYKRMRLMTSLIFLNVAALHHYPYSSLLFYLGKEILFECVEEKRFSHNE